MKSKINLFGRILSILLLITIAACSNKKIEKNTEVENKVTPVSETKMSSIPQSESPTTDLDKAKKEGKAVFLLITGAGATGMEKAASIIKEASDMTKNSVIVQLNKDEAKNSSLVTKFQIGTVPVPFILVISPNGIPVAGAPPAQVTSDQLVKTIPTPKQDEVFLAINEKKPVMIVVSRSEFPDKKKTILNCTSAGSKINTKPVIIQVDFDDFNEKSFLNQLGITNINGKTVTVVINSSGQITETFTDIPKIENLTAAANKIIQNKGCSPGGCAPSGCN